MPTIAAESGGCKILVPRLALDGKPGGKMGEMGVVGLLVLVGREAVTCHTAGNCRPSPEDDVAKG